MRKPQFLSLVAALSLALVVILVVTATVGMSGTELRGEEGTRPVEDMILPAPADGTVLAKGLPDFSPLVERANPAVVSVINEQYRAARDQREHIDPFWWFFRNSPHPESDEEEEDAGPTRRETVQGSGSGFLIASNGYILTNHHVIEDADTIWVDLEDGRRFEAYLMGTDRHTDVALLKIDAEDLPALPMGDSEGLQVGEWVVAIGNPLTLQHTVTAGVVSAKGRDVPLEGVDNALSQYIQTDAAINFGNSGGPLLNTRGEVVGINTAITRGNRYQGDSRMYTGVVQGIGFALPINAVQAIVDQLRESGRVARGYLGVSLNTLQAIDEDNFQVFGLPDPRGALIAGVESGTPARRAGIEPGDVVREFNGEPVEDNEDLIRRVSRHRPGERVEVGVVRYGESMSFEVRLGDRSEGIYGESTQEFRDDADEMGAELGFSVEPIDEQLLEHMGIEDIGGIRVASVDPKSSASRAGLVQGMIIVEVGRREIDDVEDFQEALEEIRSGDPVTLRVAVAVSGRRVTYQYLSFRAP